MSYWRTQPIICLQKRSRAVFEEDTHQILCVLFLPGRDLKRAVSQGGAHECHTLSSILHSLRPPLLTWWCTSTRVHHRSSIATTRSEDVYSFLPPSLDNKAHPHHLPSVHRSKMYFCNNCDRLQVSSLKKCSQSSHRSTLPQQLLITL